MKDFPTTLNLYANGPLLADKANKRGRNKRIVASTMDEDDLQSLYCTLADHFKDLAAHEHRGDLSSFIESDLGGVFGEDGEDMGVTAHQKQTYEELSTLLGFPEGRPPLFSKFRSKDSTINSWDDPVESSKWTQGGDDLQPLALKWHQLCGVASMVDKMFVQDGGVATNVLLADDVGLGKSAQIMAFIAFLVIVWYSEKDSDNPRPPIVGGYFFTELLWQFWPRLPRLPLPTACKTKLISLA